MLYNTGGILPKTYKFIANLAVIFSLIQRGLSNDPPRLVGLSSTIIKQEYITKVGDVIGSLTAEDRDGTKAPTFSVATDAAKELVRLSDPPRNVGLKMYTVDIILNKELDRDYEPEERHLYFEVSDGSSKVDARVTLFIIDYNDEAPRFDNQPYRVTVYENVPVGTMIYGQISAIDPDKNDGGRVSYRMEPEAQNVDDSYRDSFRINSTGKVFINKSLDYEQHSFYQFSVYATDLLGLQSLPAEFVITVQDVQDTPPFFVSRPYTEINENALTGSSVLQVSALDGDRGIPNDITYKFVAGDHSMFNINPTTGLITVESVLMRGVYTATVEASEVIKAGDTNLGDHKDTTVVTIVVEDINDNAPVFNREHNMATVLENMQKGVPITITGDPMNVNDTDPLEVTDNDQGDNSYFELSVEKGGVPYSDFSPHPASGFSKSQVVIKVNNQAALDYEINQQIVFEVVARETKTTERRSSTATVTLHIEDMNDNIPQFSETSYAADVQEHSPVDTPITTVQATDKDSGTNGDVSYSIRGGNNRFKIDANSGQVSVAMNDIDREQIDEYYLTVEAKDGGGYRNTTELKITVTDINDQAPVFKRSEYEGILKENSASFERPMQVEATDADQTGLDNSAMLFEIVSTPPGLENNFTIDANTGIIAPKQPLDYEKLDSGLNGEVILVVKVKDLGTPQLSSQVNVRVIVEDENDNLPVFAKTQYASSILENAAEGTTVKVMTASDADGTAPNNQFLYRIESGAQDKFRIDYETGAVTVESGAKLDRETKAYYSLVISTVEKVSSTVTPGTNSQCLLNITIDDVNDELPVFNPMVQSATIMENEGTTKSVTMFTAVDSDVNHELRYSLLTDLTEAYDENNIKIDAVALNVINYFDIEETTGKVFIKSTLDRETAEKVTLVIKVTDVNGFQPQLQTATGTLSVTILDYNDKHPEFQPSNIYRVNISEGLPVSSEVLRVSATDADKSQLVLFYMDHDSSGKFHINTLGRVTLQAKLDRETEDSIQFTIKAIDDGVPALTSTGTVIASVTDINDNTPVFDPHNDEYSVKENANVGDFVVRISATDSDLGDFQELYYTLQNEGSKNDFSINSSTGEIKVAGALNREETSSYTYYVIVKDNMKDPDNQKTARTRIKIMITDINDETPLMVPPHDMPTIMKNVVTDTKLFTVTATDLDEGDNARVDFTLTSATNATNLFKIVTLSGNTGDVLVSSSLMESVGVKFITIQATDNGSPSLSSTMVLKFEILDVNVNQPEFVHPSASGTIIQVREEQPVNTEIIMISAKDDDYGNNGEVEYSLVVDAIKPDWQKFQIDRKTGRLSNAERLDKEAQETYEITVNASDHGIPKILSKTLTLIIKLLDVNDQSPEFDCGPSNYPLTMTVSEEQDNVTVGTLHGSAVDKDSADNNSIVCYYLVGGDHMDYFSVEPQTGLLNVTQRIDYDGTDGIREVNLVIRASDYCFDKNPVIVDWTDVQSCGSGINRNRTLLWLKIFIRDINDNAPVFNSRELAYGVTKDTQFGSIIFDLKAEVKDLDSGKNAEATFTQGEIKASPSELADKFKGQKPFILYPNGTLKTNVYFQADMFGYFNMNVTAQDVGKLKDWANVRISLVNDDQRVKVIFRKNMTEVIEKKSIFIKRLEEITGYRIIVDKIQTHIADGGSAEPTMTDMFIHGEDKATGRVVDAQTLLDAIDFSAKDLIAVLNEFNIEKIVLSKRPVTADDSERTLRMAVILLAVVLGLLVIILAASFYTSRRKYQRKLKAATAMAFGSQDSDLHKLDFPGTNKHAYENANPIFLEQAHLGEADDGQNSLDENSLGPLEQNNFDEQEIAINLYNEDKLSRDKVPSSDIYLTAAIEEHNANKKLREKQNVDTYQISNGHIFEDKILNTRNLESLIATDI